MSRKLLIPLIILGFLLVGAATMFALAQRPTVGAMDEQIALVGRMIVRGEDSIAIPALAQRMVEDRRDFVLVDLRSPGSFLNEHIPGARNVPLTEVLRLERAQVLAGGRTLILYSQQTTEAAQVAILLRAAGVDAVALRGGFSGWQRFIADPDSASEAVAPVLTRAERQALACFFQGDYMPTAGIPIASVRTAYTPPLSPVAVAPVVTAPEIAVGTPAAPDPAVAAGTVSAAAQDPLGLGQHLGLGILPPVPASHPDPLGLGLHLGLGLVSLPVAHPDPLGLGLALGLGVGISDPAVPGADAGSVGASAAAASPAVAPTPAAAPATPAPAPRRALRIGEGC